MAKRMKRTLSLLLTAVLLLGMLPITAAAAESSNQQISNPGGTVYYDTDGTQYQEGTLGEDGIVVKMTKMVEGTCCFANKLRKFFKQSAKKKRRLKGF